MGQSQKRKGTRVEREMVALFKKAGFDARRVPLSGAAEGFPGDVKVRMPDGEWLTCEVKARKGGEGFKTLERWLGANDLLLLKRNMRGPLAVIELDKLLELMAGGE